MDNYNTPNSDSALETAAKRSRLPFDRITLNELKCFPELRTSSNSNKELFLFIRNKLLNFWLDHCLDQLTLENCLPKFPASCRNEELLISRLIAFLERYGFINYGFYRFAKFYPRRQQQIIILGAGIAGLTAARQLESFGCDTVILEARHRTGGRMSLFSKGHYIADLGAMVVTGLLGSPVAILSQQMNLELIKINDVCPLFDYTGEKVMKEKDDLIEKEFNRLLESCAFLAHNVDVNEHFGREFSLGDTFEYVIKMQEKLVKDKQLFHWKTLCSIQDRQISVYHKLSRRKNEITRLELDYLQARALEAPLDPQENAMHDFTVRYKRFRLDEACRNFEELLRLVESLEETLKAQEQAQPSDVYLSPRDRRMLDWHVANLEFANAAPLDKLSLKHWDQDDIYEFGGSHSTVKNGYASIPLKLAEGLNIRYGSIAKEVTISPDDAEVIFVEGNTEHRIKADAVLCTLPLGVLKASLDNNSEKKNVNSRVTFKPDLPERKLKAIKNLGFGCLNKVVLCFDQSFWDQNCHMFGYVNRNTESRGEFFLFWTFYEEPVIIALIAGKSAEILETLSDQIIVERCLTVLRTIFSSEKVPTPQETVVTRWGSDPFSLGSYSYVGVGATGEDYEAMAESVGVGEKRRLFFAGEHTCRQYPATVHGAMISGLREAGKIADAVLGPLNVTI